MTGWPLQSDSDCPRAADQQAGSVTDLLFNMLLTILAAECTHTLSASCAGRHLLRLILSRLSGTEWLVSSDAPFCHNVFSWNQKQELMKLKQVRFQCEFSEAALDTMQASVPQQVFHDVHIAGILRTWRARCISSTTRAIGIFQVGRTWVGYSQIRLFIIPIPNVNGVDIRRTDW